MLKHLVMNGKNIPLPVPIKDVEGALDWVEKTLLTQGQVITKIRFNDQEMFVEEFVPPKKNKSFKNDDVFELVVDTPYKLLIQLIEALHGISGLVYMQLKDVAVHCWSAMPKDQVESLNVLERDLQLLFGLLENIDGFVSRDQVDIAPVLGLGVMIRRYFNLLQQLHADKNLKECARVLLNKLEPDLKHFKHEIENLHIRALQSKPRT